MFSTKTFVITFLASALLVCVSASINFSRAEVQQRQIDQLCSFVFKQAECQGTLEESGLQCSLRYNLIFADFARGAALLNAKSRDPEEHDAGHIVIVSGIPPKVLQDWCDNRNDVH